MKVLHSSDIAYSAQRRSSFCNDLKQTALLDPAERFRARSGKRIRKSVVDLVFTMAGGIGPPPACLGESIEWLHAGSLVIDDIQDDSPVRRERPSLHMEMGVPLALNAGNWMYFEALNRLFDDSLNRSVQHRLLQKLIETGRRCHHGQALDLGARVDQIEPVNIGPLVSEISRLKTGSLVAMAATFGAVAAGANQTLRNALSRFGMNVGIALQMRNDLEELRLLSQDTSEGLPIRTDDLRNARITWPWAWAYQACTGTEFERLVVQLRSAQHRKGGIVDLASQLLNSIGGLGDSVIQDRVKRHLRLLGEHILDVSSLQKMRTALQVILEPINKHTSGVLHVKLA